MSFTIQKIELSNIRSHCSYVFQPAQEGITAISGANGTGKSSIVDSIPWILYGTKPAGISRTISIMRRGTDLTKEKCFAKIHLSMGATSILVERKIVSKQGAVECNVFEKSEQDADYRHTAGPSVSHAEPYIRRLLQLDEKGFLAAVLIQQKQVDQLIVASPKERSEVIEKLLGISSITAALGEAKQNYSSIKKSTKNFTLDENLLPKLQGEVEKLEKRIEQATSRGESQKEKALAAKAKMQSLSEKIQKIEEHSEKARELQQILDSSETVVSSLKEELERLLQQKEERKRDLAQSSGPLQGEGTIEEQLAEAKKLSSTHKLKLAQLSSEANSLEAQTEALQQRLEQAPASTAPQIDEALQNAEAKKSELESKMTQLQVTKVSLQDDLKKYTKSQEIMSTEDSTCPVCLQEISDPQRAHEIAAERIEEIQQRLDRWQPMHEKLQNSIVRAEKVVANYRGLQSALEEIEQNKQKLEKIADSIEELQPESLAAEAEVQTLEKVYLKLQQNRSLRHEYQQLHEAALQCSNRIEEKQRQRDHAKKELASLGSVSSSREQKMRGDYRSASEEYIARSEAFSSTREELFEAKAQLETTRRELQQAEQEAEQYRASLASIEAASKTVEVIEEFRAQRTAQSIPAVTIYASELINKFSGGKFTQILLDEKFNATVCFASGEQSPVGLLSGGELSAASLALRLSISMMLNAGKSKTALILDEVLVSQDDERSERILHAITEACSGQVILISHGATTNEIADAVVEL